MKIKAEVQFELEKEVFEQISKDLFLFTDQLLNHTEEESLQTLTQMIGTYGKK